MHIDCDTCIGRHTEACDDCVVTFILHSGSSLDLETEEMEALDLLAEEGLVPRLRLIVDPKLKSPELKSPKLESTDADQAHLDRDRRRA